MSQPYVGEIRMIGCQYAPAGWAFCQGQLYPISEFELLFNIIGTTYGGDGQSTFGLPNLAGRTAMHQGGGYTPGMLFGSETVTLSTSQILGHTHQAYGSVDTAQSSAPQNNIPASLTPGGTTSGYGTSFPGQLKDSQIPYVGGQPHENRQPYQVVSFIISLFGIYPSVSDEADEAQRRWTRD